MGLLLAVVLVFSLIAAPEAGLMGSIDEATTILR